MRWFRLLALACLASGAGWSQSPRLVSDSAVSSAHRKPVQRSAPELGPARRNGVIMNVFPDMTPGSGESQEGSPTQHHAPPARRPARHGLPLPPWRHNPLLMHPGRTTDA